MQKSGRFRDRRHFCLYFNPVCELGPSQAQAQNKSHSHSLWNLLVLTPIKQGYVWFLWTIFLNSRLKLEYCGPCAALCCVCRHSCYPILTGAMHCWGWGSCSVFSDARQIVVSSGTSLLSLCIWDMCGNKHLEHVLVYCGFFEETEALSSKLKASC